MPVVNVGNKENPAYVPPEFCLVAPGQMKKSRLSPDQTGIMIKMARRDPDQNFRSINDAGYEAVGLDRVTTAKFVSPKNP